MFGHDVAVCGTSKGDLKIMRAYTNHTGNTGPAEPLDGEVAFTGVHITTQRVSEQRSKASEHVLLFC